MTVSLGDVFGGLAFLLSIYATIKTIKFNERQKALIILGEAVLAVGKQGRPINTRTLLEYLQVMQDKQKRRDDKIAMQTAIDVLRDNQRINGRR
ncbi:hypothetical protein [Klebsiella variicola]